MAREIMDFTQYAEEIGFTFKGETYFIPAFNKTELRAIMEINSKRESKKEDVEGEDKEKKEEEDNVKYFDYQDEMLAIGVYKKGEKGERIKLDISHFEEWPVAVKNKVMDIVNEQMSLMTKEDIESEKK